MSSSPELSQLQTTIKHLLASWPVVLQRRLFLRRMAQSEALRTELQQTYAGHVFNAIHGAISFDIVRAVGALILDRDRNSASLRRAVMALQKPVVVRQLRSIVYGVAASKPVRVEAEAAMHRILGSEFDSVFERIPVQLEEIDKSVLDAPVVSVIKTIRNKAVAHSALEAEGIDWKVWAVGNVKLTYAELDQYIDSCTAALGGLSHLVLRTAFCFDDLDGINQRYADDYIEALLIGLREQKKERARQREENLRRTQELIAKAGL